MTSLRDLEAAISTAVAAGDLEEVTRLREQWREVYAVERVTHG
jgi:hypothetical protein